jgi:multidrug resistance efflux pump
MLELALCSLFTIFPDYLYRRYRQGKRFGREITLYSVWFELRWGITACIMLTVLLITIIFYNHPSTTSVTAFYRTVPILPEASGRVSEIYIKWRDNVEKGTPIFKLDSSKQEADLEVAKRRIVEVGATMVMAQADIAAAEGQIQQAKGAYQ